MGLIKKYQKFFWGIAAGAIAAVLIINRHWFAPLYEPTMAVLNSNATTAFMGALGGAGVVYLLDRLSQKKRLLADINTSLGIVAGISNALLNIKAQHAKPTLENYKKNLEKLEQVKNIPPGSNNSEGTLDIRRTPCPGLGFELPTENIFASTKNSARLALLIAETQRMTAEVMKSYDSWNTMVFEMQNNASDEERFAYYFGHNVKTNLQDTTFKDTLEMINMNIDNALFYSTKVNSALTKLADEALPFWLRDKVAQVKIDDPEFVKLLPSHNHIKGWADE